MYKIVYYKDAKGREPVKDFLDELEKRKDKDSKINFNKSRSLIRKLALEGLNLGMPYIRRIRGDLWELRPMRNRIFFFGFNNDCFVLLHQYYKRTKKTPISEIEKAEKEMFEFKKGVENE